MHCTRMYQMTILSDILQIDMAVQLCDAVGEQKTSRIWTLLCIYYQHKYNTS